MPWQKWRRWTNWIDLKGAIESAPKKPGIYVIRHAPRGSAKVIHRAGGDDPDGILYVGTTVDLMSRLKQFRRGCVRGNKSHSGGATYYHYNYARNFPLDELQVGWETYLNDEQARDAEREILNDYRRFLLDNPPLNIAAERKY